MQCGIGGYIYDTCSVCDRGEGMGCPFRESSVGRGGWRHVDRVILRKAGPAWAGQYYHAYKELYAYEHRYSEQQPRRTRPIN